MPLSSTTRWRNVSTVTVMTYMTVDLLDDVLREVGLSTDTVVREHNGYPGLWLDAQRLSGGKSRLILVVTSYALNEKGARYLSGITGEVATETRRFFIEGVGPLAACPTVKITQ